jgi:hypothetical protein
LLIGEVFHGYTPRELAILMGWGANRNQEVGDKMRGCRRALENCLGARGIDASFLRGLS